MTEVAASRMRNEKSLYDRFSFSIKNHPGGCNIQQGGLILLQGILFDFGKPPGILGRGGGNLFQHDHRVGRAVHGKLRHFLYLQA